MLLKMGKRTRYLKYLKYVLIILAALLAVRILFSICINSINDSRLRLEENTQLIDLKSLLNIDSSRISSRETAYFKKKDICFNCIIDEKYLLTVFKAGKVSDGFNWNRISLDTLENIKNKYDYITSIPTSIFTQDSKSFPVVYFSEFNSTSILNTVIDDINLDINGKLIERKKYDEKLLILQIDLDTIIFTYNKQKNKLDLCFSYSLSGISPSFIVFKIDEVGQLYICATNYPIDFH